MTRRRESNIDLLIRSPWWVSVVLAFGAFVVFTQLATVSPPVAPLAPLSFLFFLCIAALSGFFQWRKGSLVDRQTGVNSLNDLTWKQFEWMVGEAYRRNGYQVTESLSAGPDGGVDLVLRRPGYTGLVQCKRWKTFSVGAPVIRELYGILLDQKADEAIVVTSGKFTREARAFAENKPITLVDGPALVRLIAGVQRGDAPSAGIRTEQPSLAPACPRCGAPMILRTARKGPNSGKGFYGCSAFPKCKGTVNI